MKNEKKKIVNEQKREENTTGILVLCNYNNMHYVKPIERGKLFLYFYIFYIFYFFVHKCVCHLWK